MGRPAVNDPSNLSETPAYNGNPVILAKNVAEFRSRLNFLSQSYLQSKTFYQDALSLNRDVERLRRGFSRKRLASHPGTRIHPILEIAISGEMLRLVSQTGNDDLKTHLRPAVESVLHTFRDRRGRPVGELLQLHVSGLVATVQTFSGKPVRARRTRNSVYDPHFAEGISQTIPLVVKDWDSTVTETQLVNIVRDIRRAHAGKPHHFEDLFPQYLLTKQSQNEVASLQIEVSGLIPRIPIYCP